MFVELLPKNIVFFRLANSFGFSSIAAFNFLILKQSLSEFNSWFLEEACNTQCLSNPMRHTAFSGCILASGVVNGGTFRFLLLQTIHFYCVIVFFKNGSLLLCLSKESQIEMRFSKCFALTREARSNSRIVCLKFWVANDGEPSSNSGLPCCIHFHVNTPWKCMNHPLFSPNMG